MVTRRSGIVKAGYFCRTRLELSSRDSYATIDTLSLRNPIGRSAQCRKILHGFFGGVVGGVVGGVDADVVVGVVCCGDGIADEAAPFVAGATGGRTGARNAKYRMRVIARMTTTAITMTSAVGGRKPSRLFATTFAGGATAGGGAGVTDLLICVYPPADFGALGFTKGESSGSPRPCNGGSPTPNAGV